MKTEIHKQNKDYKHIPVLLSDILSFFPDDFSPQKFLDCTFGRGGHSLSILKKYPQIKILALDRDEEAIEYGKSLDIQDQIKFLKINFHDFSKQYAQQELFDIVLMDLGVSSPQLEKAERGFSFYQDGPLDMRMDRDQSLTAADIVNSFSKKELEDLFCNYGEIKRPFAIVDSIFSERQKKKFKTTRDLVNVIQKHVSRGFSGRHPATPYFLALRMFVNQELEGLEKNLPSFLSVLEKGSYFIIVTFHSLEDRIVKRAFNSFVLQGEGRLGNKKVIRPSSTERQSNPRSRSAKLRVFIKE